MDAVCIVFLAIATVLCIVVGITGNGFRREDAGILTHLPYLKVPSERPWGGAITFENVCLRYPDKRKWVLWKIKVGIMGRTGAGKSSLMSLLFRLFEVQRGRALIDGVNISQVHLADLRGRISVITAKSSTFL
ncbi:ABC-type transporter cicA [Taenia crassiceps]|uniref:ABC-type transporter cicA n=1 Tax=Taenia crassiceps TaxID=6207 RepID=A0ABR4QH68_9CEST